ncbi:MAG TPA: hypothetical protein VK880_01825, partial [Anaerolineales bacterium]|nr:hypothetical protein [Anaerolineales bacterium]
DGTRLGPRMFSNLSDAPYVGETALLFSLTRPPLFENGAPADGYAPASVYLGILFYLVCGGLLVWRAVFLLKRWEGSSGNPIPQPKLQLVLLIALLLSGVIMLIFFNKLIGVVLIFLMQTLPTRGRIWSWLIDYEALNRNS